uniref:NADH-ubiquinone oxidoreductase chain 4 n=1 Tax=Siboglinum plumosum TaxID=3080496 RepID=A0AA96WN55_9ANNE|nr:NADH dehydrogenase subunit 4 [Siboglinum plumosum]WNZ34608.1 NADH dehydrogenase subunit 4 [Siboglinum plumosum]
MLKFFFFFMSFFLLFPTLPSHFSWSALMNSLFLSTPLLVIFMINPLNYLSSLTFYFSLDSMSNLLILLSFWITALMLMASTTILMMPSHKLFMKTSLLLLAILILAFSTNNLLLFYIFFEASLIPIFSMIMIWGYQPERLQASLYLILYTISASLPLLILIFFMLKVNFHLNIFFYNWNFPCSSMNLIMYLLSLLAFLVKLPMFLLHLWLPKAHVEAPVAGSMILASALLKLGSYGLFRFTEIFQSMNIYLSSSLIPLSLVGGSLISFLCLRQTDMKALIAYSSVSHMALLLSGLLPSFSCGMKGALILMISHGLCSSSLFFLVNILYSLTHTRSIFLTKGILAMFPMFSFWWFISNMINMSAPPSINLLSEILLISSILPLSLVTTLPLFLMMFFTAAYSLYIYSSSQHGPFLLFLNNLNSINSNYLLLISLHLIPLLLLVIKLSLFF